MGDREWECPTLSFFSEDLASDGIVLVPHTSPDYRPLLADIQRRIEEPQYESSWLSTEVREHILGRIVADDCETSAILLNNSGKSIASMILLWRLTERSGRVERHTNRWGGDGLLVPTRLDPVRRKMLGYWWVIMPNSKRYICLNGVAGDNSDVRLPAADEIYTGGFVQWGSPPGNQHLLRSATLSIDSIFFTDGEFIGPDTEQLWERTQYKAELMKSIAAVAREGYQRGDPRHRIFAAIEEITGPEGGTGPIPPPPGQLGGSDFLVNMERLVVATSLGQQRRENGDESALVRLLAWAESNPPRLYRRSPPASS